MIECPLVADPNRPGFGCAFSSVGSSDVENVTMSYVEKDTDGNIESPEVVRTTKGLGRLCYPIHVRKGLTYNLWYYY